MAILHVPGLFSGCRRAFGRMFRNQYDTDCITWSPAGRIHQIEYAMEAVKQGSAAIGLRSNTYAIVATLKRSSSELSSYQKKIFVIDDNMGIAIAGAPSPPPHCSRRTPPPATLGPALLYALHLFFAL